jgi:hypothetical protein
MAAYLKKLFRHNPLVARKPLIRVIRTVRDQLAALSAATIRLALIEDGRAVQVNTQIVKAFELWVPKSESQQILWPSTVAYRTTISIA